ncbi:MAG TPA: ATP-grasp domain-containing protein [Polyangiaceae bacterium]|nr:ATP-grasp domain-containing protein [Polyangiaceae bacterium]
MAKRPVWLLEFDPDFPGPALVAPHVEAHVVLGPRRPWDDEWPEVAPPFVAYGTMRTLRAMQRRPGLSAAVFDHYPSLRCSSYYRAVYDLLGRVAYILPLGGLPHARLERAFGARAFVRPDTNDKRLAAQPLDTARVAEFVELYREHRDELVVVSEFVELGDEYRCFCRDGRAFCHSSYPAEPYRPAPPEVVAFAERAAARLAAVVPSRMLSVDVAAGAGGALRLVEVGGVNSWGLYGGDPRAFVAAMEAEALELDAERRG